MSSERRSRKFPHVSRNMAEADSSRQGKNKSGKEQGRESKRQEVRRMEEQTEQRKGITKAGTSSIRPRLKVQIEGTEPFFGPGVRMLRLHIRTEGSVREACEKRGLSYSKGRKLLDRAERELGYAIVERTHGGKNGGACLSEDGIRFLEKYERFEQELTETAEKKFREIFE